MRYFIFNDTVARGGGRGIFYMEDKSLVGTVVIKDRKSITLDGVESIDAFDESYISLSTNLGKMIIEGSSLKVENLSKESGEIYITGHINSIFYTEEKAKKNYVFRLFK